MSRMGDHTAGARMIQEAQAQHRQAGFLPGASVASRFLGQVMRAAGDDVQAAAHMREALALDPAMAQQWHIANAVETLASIAADDGQAEVACRLFGAVAKFRDLAEIPLEPALQSTHEATLRRLRSELGDERFGIAWAQGSATTIEEAIAVAVSLELRGETIRPQQPPAAPSLLSPREVEVLRLVVEGRSTAEIATLLFISPRSVGTHIAHILEKLDVGSRSAAVALALKQGLI
jgi:DNA-binding CsgD family transcriptional regulator